MDKVLLATTSSVEGARIEQYLGVISTTLEYEGCCSAGSFATIPDDSKGEVEVYDEIASALYAKAEKIIIGKALARGANAVIGLKIDYSTVVLEGRLLFRVLLYGTAVSLIYNIVPSSEVDIPLNEVYIPYNENYTTCNVDDSGSDFIWEEISPKRHNVFDKKTIQKKMVEDYLDEDDWDLIIKDSSREWMEPLYQYYLKHCKNYTLEYHPLARVELERYKKYLCSLSYLDAVEYAYRDVRNFEDVIKKRSLFSANMILKLAKQEGHLSQAISLLDTIKSSCNEDDLEEIKNLMHHLTNLPKVGKKSYTYSSFTSPAEMKYKCSCGKKNDVENEFCVRCGKNTYGITKEEKAMIEEFCNFAETLFHKT